MKYLKRTGKILAAGLCAFAILNVLFCFYYYRPMRMPNPIGNTDFIAPPNSIWVGMNEGLSWGRFDGQGFNNPQVVESPNILVLGSSHMEATYVKQDQLLSVQLGRILGPEARVYNMGTSGNNLLKCLQYLPKTLQACEEAPDLLIIETSGVSMSEEEVRQVISGTVPSIFRPKAPKLQPILGLPFMRQLAHQKNKGLLELLNPPRVPHADSLEEPSQKPILPADAPEGAVYTPLFQYLREILADRDTKVLIFFHPSESLREDGSVSFRQDPMRDVFAARCRENGIGFLDLTEKFEIMYREDHLLPHGFINGNIGTGHLNANGHRAAAEAIAQWIDEEGN